MKNLKLSFTEIQGFDEYFEINDNAKRNKILYIILLSLFILNHFYNLYEVNFDLNKVSYFRIISFFLWTILIVIEVMKNTENKIQKKDIKEIIVKKYLWMKYVVIRYKNKERKLSVYNDEVDKLVNFLNNNK